MATPSQVKAGLDDIAEAIRSQRQALTSVINGGKSVAASLVQLPDTFADVVATVNGYAQDGTPFETVSKSELDALTAEFIALKATADAVAALDA